MTMEKRHLDNAENPRPSHYYSPYIDIELQFDPLQADPLLQKSLVLDSDSDSNSDNGSETHFDQTDATYTDDDNDNRWINNFSMTTTSNHSFANHHKRKLSLAESSNATSDTSGRFDDADESDLFTKDVSQPQPVLQSVEKEEQEHENKNNDETRSVHSAKRGRSNGWPMQSEIAYDEHGMRIDMNTRRNTPTPTPTKAAKGSNHANSPGAKPSPVLRIRRSRFIEGSMNDRVSEKPPSILFVDDRNRKQTQQPSNLAYNLPNSETTAAEKKNLEKRASGIFRFGKVIASAFHPFGSKGNNKSEIWKVSQPDSGPKSQKEIMNDRQARAEKAYAELKRSGYKGTSTANMSFNTGNKVDASIADETWKSIQEKLGYKISDDTRMSQDDTLVAVSGIREDGLTPIRLEKGISKLKSFSELRKRTSNLSIPAIRFRDVSPVGNSTSSDRGEDFDHDQQQYYSSSTHRPMERRQSRKELYKQSKLLKRVSNLEDKLERARRELREYATISDGNSNNKPSNKQQLLIPVVPTICVDDEHGRQFEPGALPTLLSESLLDKDVNRDGATVQQRSGQKPAKWPPVDSLSRKHKQATPTMGETQVDVKRVNNDIPHSNMDEDYDADCGKTSNGDDNNNINKSPGATANPQTEKRLRDKLKSARDKRASSLTTKASQRLKAKQSSRNLRSSATADSRNKTSQDDKTTTPHLQEQEGNVSSASTPTTPSKNKKTFAYYGSGDDENIPPVPPVPKELLTVGNGASTAKATKLAATELMKKSISKQRASSREFSWPEDIF